jgi:hypothetical protein
MSDDPRDATAYHRRLPYGERVPVAPLLESPLFPFDGEILVRPLEPPVIPEPPRRGGPEGGPCPACTGPDDATIWRDAHWKLGAGRDPLDSRGARRRAAASDKSPAACCRA